MAIRSEGGQKMESRYLDDALALVYIGQNVHDNGLGVLIRDCESFPEVGSLVQQNLVQDYKWYKAHLFRTTPSGTRAAEALTAKRMESSKNELAQFLDDLPPKLARFLISECLLSNDSTGRFVHDQEDGFGSCCGERPWRSKTVHLCLLDDLEANAKRDAFFRLALDCGLAVKVHDYVSKGETRSLEYVIAPQLHDVLRERLVRIGGTQPLLADELEDSHRLFHLFTIHWRVSGPIINGSQLNPKNQREFDAFPRRLTAQVDKALDDLVRQEALVPVGDGYKVTDVHYYREYVAKSYFQPLVDELLRYEKASASEKGNGIKTLPQSLEDRPTQEPAPSVPEALEQREELTILLGSGDMGKVFWVPAKEHNWNLAIVGASGTGKTQTVQAILNELAQRQLPYVVFDFKSDYVPAGATGSKFGSVLDLEQISINPLELDLSNSPRDQKYQVSDIIDLVYSIGDRQVGYIRDAIKMSYADKGIDEDDKATWSRPNPTFADLQQNLEILVSKGQSQGRDAIKGIFARLDPIFDYRVFAAKTVVPFDQLMTKQTIVNLGQMKNDKLKAVVSEFLLRKLRYFLYTLDDSRQPRMFIVIDEAHRLKYERETSAGQLLKEARSKGVGMLLATQDPVDFTDVVYNNSGGVLSLCVPDPHYAKKIAEHLGGNVTWQNVKNDLSGKFSAYVKFSSRPDVVAFRVIPFYERKPSQI